MPTTVREGSEPISIDSRRKREDETAPKSVAAGPSVYAFLAAELVIAAALFASQVPLLQGSLIILAILIALDVFAEANPVRIYKENYVTAGFVVVAAIIVLYGAPGVLIAAAFEALAPLTYKNYRRDLWVLHNGAMFAIVYTLAAESYGYFAIVGPTQFGYSMIPGILVASGATIGLSLALVAAFGKLYGNRSPTEFWREHNWIIPHYFALGVTGLALALTIVALDLAGAFVFVIPLLMLRLSMKQYVDKTQDNVEKLKEQNLDLKKANIEVVRVSEELRLSYDGTLEALVNALDARDQETKGHSLRVQRYMMDIAREFGVPEGSKEWIDMQRGSLLHDVGKIGVSDSILLKPGKLTDEEWGAMQKHPEIGFNMLKQVRFLEGAAEIILAHHERWDGNGYPNGLHEDEIPLGARIFMVCDTFDSMTSDRPYRKALSTQEALNEILKHGGAQFDPKVVEAFLDVYDTWVKQRMDLHGERNLRAA